MKVLFNTIYYVFLASIITIALLLVITIVPVPGNLKAKIVKSGSMEPTIKTGALVFIKPSASYKVGDIVTFGADTKTQIPTTHRIVEVIGSGSLQRFSTKGDANDSADPQTIRLSDIHGKVFFSLPYLGYVLDFARQPLGFALLIGVPTVIIIIDEIGKILREVSLMRRKKLLNATEQQKQS